MVCWSAPPVEDPVGEQDHPGAGAVRRQPGAHALAQRLEQAELQRELAPSSWTPRPGGPGASTAAELGGATYGRRGRAGRLERADVLADVALQGEHADVGEQVMARGVMSRRKHPKKGRRAALRHYQPRSARRWSAGDVVDVDADHGLAEAAGDLGDDVGVVVGRSSP